jgi:LmbE family N-acetylglucosaminyl deacetylase
MTGTRPASLLVVLAHPDDEIFHGGVLAHLSDRGVRVTLASATNGEAGTPHPSMDPVADLGAPGDDAPERLFYGTMLSDVFRALADASRGRGITDGLDPDVFASSPEMVAVSFDASSYLERKRFALIAHRSAFGVTPEMLQDPPPRVAQLLRTFRPVLEREVFLLGGARGPVRRWPLRGFFDGLETAELQ